MVGEVRFFQAQDQPSVTTHVRVGNRVFSHLLDVVSKMHIYTSYTVIDNIFIDIVRETVALLFHLFCGTVLHLLQFKAGQMLLISLDCIEISPFYPF